MSEKYASSSTGPNTLAHLPAGFQSDMTTLASHHIDEAAESVINETDIPQSSANIIRELLAKDSNSAVAQSYYDHFNARGTARLRTRMRRAAIHVNYYLTDAQIVTLTSYAPEYELVFGNSQLHDHPMAAAMRMLDHNIINSRIPAGARVTDVGGDALYHINAGHTNVHCCDPIVDVKDESRQTLRNLAVQNLLKAGDFKTPEVGVMLRSYVSMDGKHFCSKRAQECKVSADVITSVHVYDVPMADWPGIMEAKGATVVEGALLFSNVFFDAREGELADSGTRYCIDVEHDTFRMGFVNSPSWWYSHKWSDFLRYGVDQRIKHGKNVYAYKIVERRKDTIFFRIIAVDSRSDDTAFWRKTISYDYVYPSVQMAEIDGFEFDSIGNSSTRLCLTRKRFSVALPLWDALVREASMDFERGVLDFQKMFNAYRTIAPKHTINGIVVSGGYTVEPDQLGLVVIHAAIVGAMRSSLTDKTNRAITGNVFETRARKAQSTGEKISGALFDSLKLGIYPFAWATGLPYLCNAFKRLLENNLLMNFVNVGLSPTIRTVTVDVIFRKVGKPAAQRQLLGANEDFSKLSANSLLHDIADSAVLNGDLAAYLLENMSDVLGTYHVARLDKAVKQQSKDNTAQSKRSLAAAVADAGPVETADTNWSGKTDKRRAAIREAIVEIMEENEITLSICKRMYSQFLVGGTNVNHVAISRDQESNGNPDLWRVVNGVLANHSVSNKLPVRDFAYAVAYSPVSGEDGSNFVTVDRHEWYDERTEETEVNFIVPDGNFTGYLLVCDALLIFNGEAILASLRSALELEHEYTVELNEGPPGCGKTHSIIHSYRDGDVVLCPVKESSQDTLNRLIAMHPGKENKLSAVVRTVDSFLVHGMRGKNAKGSYVRILADECFMTHAGKWYAAAALIGVEAISAYGDTKQIPHIPRVQVPKDHIRLEYDTRTFNPITRRCPADSVAAWAHLYDNLVRSTNTITNSLVEVNSYKMIQVSKDTCLMGMYQADKKEIRKLFPNHENTKGKGNLIVTTHEAEGKTYREVVLFRFDRRRRKDKLSLYDKTPYALVAISRHTEKFTYVRPDGLGDLVSQMVQDSKNPRRVQDILKVGDAGKRYN